MKVPFVDLHLQHQNLHDELAQQFQTVMARCDFALGEDVTRLEEEFASYLGIPYAVGVDSGLSALELALRAYGIGAGDEVIVPAHTFIATAAAVTFCGAKPIFVDVNPCTYDIDVAQAEAAITPHTRAIIPVHLYGLPADMSGVLTLAARHGLLVVEDACQAHGALYGQQRTGTLGHAGAFSFYPTKNLGACGDAGMLVTRDAQIAERVRAMRNCGQRVKYCHEFAPFNHRLDTLQAAILRVKLPHLDSWNEARMRAAKLYDSLLADCPLRLPTREERSTHVHHLYVVRTADRDALQAYLKTKGVGTAIHYPAPVHVQPFYLVNGVPPADCPQSEQLCDEILSLPMFPEITDEQVRYVSTQIHTFFEEGLQS
ncbi:MAG TPA: DegT/DnrJ/EryC1/StrS family aminotransferase [Phototrophicaceae bacterium]|nr:DegT/DnrJ/EryC1/StrS family aminotransferase [Phototrophicaceae bacterium]